jgi:hypothetical protein
LFRHIDSEVKSQIRFDAPNLKKGAAHFLARLVSLPIACATAESVRVGFIFCLDLAGFGWIWLVGAEKVVLPGLTWFYPEVRR